jgi:hypothetical protein
MGLVWLQGRYRCVDATRLQVELSGLLGLAGRQVCTVHLAGERLTLRSSGGEWLEPRRLARRHVEVGILT